MEAPYSPNEENSADARELNVLAELYDALDSRPRDIEIHEMLIGAWLAIDESGTQICSSESSFSVPY